MGIRSFNLAALLDFQNVIGPNGLNSDNELNNFAGCDFQKKLSADLQTSLSQCTNMGKGLFEPHGT